MTGTLTAIWRILIWGLAALLLVAIWLNYNDPDPVVEGEPPAVAETVDNDDALTEDEAAIETADTEDEGTEVEAAGTDGDTETTEPDETEEDDADADTAETDE